MEVAGEDIEGVGFDFQVFANPVTQVLPEPLVHAGGGAAEKFVAFPEEGDVEVNAGGFEVALFWDAFEGFGEVGPREDGCVAPLLGFYLMEVDRFFVGFEFVEVVDLAEMEGGADVNFGKQDAFGDVRLERVGEIFVLDRHMAAVEIDAEVASQDFFSSGKLLFDNPFAFEQHVVVEEGDEFWGGLEVAGGFRFEAEMNEDAVFFVNPVKVDDGFGDAFDQLADIRVGFNPRFEGAGDGADGALLSGGEKEAKGISDGVGVADAFWASPIGGVDLFFYASTVKGSVGEGVDSKCVEVFAVELVLEFGKSVEIS